MEKEEIKKETQYIQKKTMKIRKIEDIQEEPDIKFIL